MKDLQKGSLLDIGSSEGKLCYLMKLKGWDVEGIEPTSHYVNFANEVLKVKTYKGFIEDFSSNKKYDLIIMSEVIEHLSNPVRVLRKIKGLLKPNGKIFITTPHKCLFRAPHLVIFSKGNLEKLLMRECGFKILKSKLMTQGKKSYDDIFILASK